MAILADPEFWIRLVGIGALNLLLSGDNALVIALAVRALPKRKRLLGQIWGALGAVVLRLIFVAVISVLLKIPFLQLEEELRYCRLMLRLPPVCENS